MIRRTRGIGVINLYDTVVAKNETYVLKCGQVVEICDGGRCVVDWGEGK